MSRPSTSSGALALSFLDVLTNGLGAMILLFVALAAAPLAPRAQTEPGEDFIRLEWTVNGDAAALLRPIIQPPGERPYRLTLAELTRASADAVSTSLPGTSGYALLGFETDGVANMTTAGSAPSRRFILWVHAPKPGRWGIGVTYFDRTDGLVKTPFAIRVDVAVTTRALRPAWRSPDHTVSFSETLMTCNVEIGQNGSLPETKLGRAQACDA